jgi:hypothetical protein
MSSAWGAPALNAILPVTDWLEDGPAIDGKADAVAEAGAVFDWDGCGLGLIAQATNRRDGPMLTNQRRLAMHP